MIFTIYQHKNKTNCKSYVGYTCQRPKRRWSHGNGYKQHPKFWNAITKYGWDNFDHVLLAYCKTEDAALKVELFFKKLFNTVENGYNCVYDERRSPMLGRKTSEETKKKLSKANKGKKMPPRSEEHKQNISKSKKGKIRKSPSEETKRKISEAGKGRVCSKETRRKISAANTGKTHSEETRRKISNSKMGHQNNLGHKHSEETKNKISISKRGKPNGCNGTRRSEESKKKMSENSGTRGKTWMLIDGKRVYVEKD